MAKHRKIEDYEIDEPLPVIVREWIVKHIVCPLIGHKPVQKFTGVIPCRRHD